MLGFSCRQKADLNFPIITESEEKILSRFLELYPIKGNVLDKLINQAEKKYSFSKKSVKFWAPKLIEGRFGPIEPLFNKNFEEIMINGINEPIYVYERKKGMKKTNISIISEEYFIELSNRMLSRLGRRVNQSNPRDSGVLENNDRVSVVIPPYGKSHILDIRRFSAEPFTVIDLIEFNMMPTVVAAFLWMVMQAGNMNVGIVGNTGSGKTTLLNALLTFLSKSTRIITVEDIPEIHPLQEQVVGMISNKSLNISMRDSIMDSLRLRPDRVIIGEVRKDQEVEALRESCLAGHAMGTYFTYHADSADLAYKRLMSQGFPKYDLSAISLVVVCRRFERGGKVFRKVVEISDGKNTIYDGKTLNLSNFNNKYFLKSFKKPKSEIKKRTEFLKRLNAKNHIEFFSKIQKVKL